MRREAGRETAFYLESFFGESGGMYLSVEGEKV